MHETFCNDTALIRDEILISSTFYIHGNSSIGNMELQQPLFSPDIY